VRERRPCDGNGFPSRGDDVGRCVAERRRAHMVTRNTVLLPRRQELAPPIVRHLAVHHDAKQPPEARLPLEVVLHGGVVRVLGVHHGALLRLPRVHQLRLGHGELPDAAGWVLAVVHAARRRRLGGKERAAQQAECSHLAAHHLAARLCAYGGVALPQPVQRAVRHVAPIPGDAGRTRGRVAAHLPAAQHAVRLREEQPLRHRRRRGSNCQSTGQRNASSVRSTRLGLAVW
jgi:hypothetical protein